MQRIVSVSVVGMKNLRQSVKYIIILQIISIIVFLGFVIKTMIKVVLVLGRIRMEIGSKEINC